HFGLQAPAESRQVPRVEEEIPGVADRDREGRVDGRRGAHASRSCSAARALSGASYQYSSRSGTTSVAMISRYQARSSCEKSSPRGQKKLCPTRKAGPSWLSAAMRSLSAERRWITS